MTLVWTPPSDWNAGVLEHDTDMNEQLGDNLKVLQCVTRMLRTAGLTVSPASQTKIVWTDVGADPMSQWASGNPTRITVQATGRYRVRAEVNGSSSAGCVPLIWKNGSFLFQGASFTTRGRIFETTIPLTAGDYLEFLIQTSSQPYVTSTFVSNIHATFNVEWKAP